MRAFSRELDNRWLSAIMAVVALSSVLYGDSGHAAEATAPIEQDFGQANEGFQLSLTFAKDQFAEDEPITAMLTTRNISDRQRSYPYVSHYVEFVIVDEQGKKVLSRDELNPDTSQLQKLVTTGKEITLLPGQEHESRIDLRKYFDLPRGRYTVSATRKVPAIDDWRVPAQVMSGNATFFSAGFKPREASTAAVQQTNRTNETATPTKADSATSPLAVTSNQRQNATNHAITESLPPERSQNVEVPSSFAQAQGSPATKLYLLLSAAALLALAFCVWFFRRKKSAV